MVPDARWTGNLLAGLHLRPNRLVVIVSPWEFGLALTSYRTHRRTSNFPIDGANCRLTVFGLSPLQWICREWVQKLGSDEATTCFGDEKHTKSGSPTSQGKGTPCSRTGMRQPLSVTQEPPPCFWASLSFLAVLCSLWDLCCYISFSSVHPPPTLVSHPCPSSSACPINHYFWHFVSCCGPHCTVQGSHPH